MEIFAVTLKPHYTLTHTTTKSGITTNEVHMNTDNQADAILNFWKSAGGKKWFSKDDAFDTAINDNFGDLMQQAINSELDHWKNNPNNCLALIIMLDQFSRNLFRNSAESFAYDAKALNLAKHGVKNNYLDKVDPDLKSFMIMPYMHSENLQDQEDCLALMIEQGLKGNVPSAQQHLDIIKTFGRFPHRNEVLNREMSESEREFLEQGGFKG